jgi:hypothetical protein
MTRTPGGENVLLGQNEHGRLEVFAPGRFMRVLNAWEREPGGEWSEWVEVPLSWTASPPALVSNDRGRLEVFAVSMDAINHVWQTSTEGGWSAIDVLSGVQGVGRPVVARNADGRLEVFVGDPDGEIRHNWQHTPNGDWVASVGRWPSLLGVRVGKEPQPAVGANADGRLELFVAAGDGGLHHAWQRYANGGFAAWRPLGVRVAGRAAPALNADGRLELFVVGERGELLRAVQRSMQQGFGEWSSLGGTWTGAPAAAGNGPLELLVRDNDGVLHSSVEPFEQWRQLAGSWSGDPVVRRGTDGTLHVVAQDADGAIHHCSKRPAADDFSEWRSLGAPTRS